MKLQFSHKAIIGTMIYLIGYQMLSFYLFLTYPNLKEPLWINQLIFATSTSLGAVFWSLYAVWKYQRIANFENLITKVYGDIEDFREQLLKFKKFLGNPLVESMLSGDDDINDSDQEQKTQELLKKYTTKRNEGNG